MVTATGDDPGARHGAGAARPNGGPVDPPASRSSRSGTGAEGGGAERERPISTAPSGPEGPPPTRIPQRWRRGSTVLLIVAAAAAIYYEIVDAGQLKQTSALFIGMPLIIGMLVAHLTRAGSIYGRAVQATIIVLAVVAPLLGEGSICIYMAAPLFIGVSVIGAIIVEAIRNRGRATGPRTLAGIALLPLVFGIMERELPWLVPEQERVVLSAEREGDLDAWRAAVRETAPVAPERSRFLRLGFPLPAAFGSEGDRVAVAFRMGGRAAGAWRAERSSTPVGAVYTLVSDTTLLAEWMRVRDTELRVESAGEGRVRIEIATRFTPLLSPRWYFVPAQRLAVSRMQATALASIEQAMHTR